MGGIVRDFLKSELRISRYCLDICIGASTNCYLSTAPISPKLRLYYMLTSLQQSMFWYHKGGYYRKAALHEIYFVRLRLCADWFVFLIKFHANRFALLSVRKISYCFSQSIIHCRFPRALKTAKTVAGRVFRRLDFHKISLTRRAKILETKIATFVSLCTNERNRMEILGPVFESVVSLT